MINQAQALEEYILQKKDAEVCLIPVLHKAKELYGEITVDVQKQIAAGLKKPLSEVAAAATFYSAFNGMSDGEADDAFIREPSRQEKCLNWILEHPADYPVLKKAAEEKPDIIGMLEAAKICGKSGSGFPLARKWALTRDVKAEQKYIICNGSEGEGNTFKDLLIFCRVPHAVIEGMVLCALATDIRQGYLYVRAEYDQAYETAKKAVEEAYQKKILGDDILGTGKTFHLEVVLGGGAYVSGEETGLLQALEGLRSEPRLKPPYPGISGLYGKPTIINNAESFAAVASLMLHGVDAFAQVGTEGAGGTKLYTVCGAVKNPGVYETSHSITAAELLALAGGAAEGTSVKGFQIGGGATGSLGNEDALSAVLDYAGCRQAGLALGTGSIRFIGREESVPDLSLSSISFLKDQSCGMCVACRYGLAELEDLLKKLCSGRGDDDTLHEIGELCAYIADSARCALGQASPTAVTTALKSFGLEFQTLCRKEEA